jgi:acetoacetate decarboxylase
MPYKVQLPPYQQDSSSKNSNGSLPCKNLATLATLSATDYHARVEATLQAVCRPDYQAGIIPWLEQGNPALYEDLTSRLPDLIHRLWEAQAPLEEFQRVVDEWLAAHRRACDLYHEHWRGTCHE